ncbi:MAG TPA: chromosomal replication initiator protein DnaA [candidate division Zixibacteria bacterium]|nr:chromosomal replication initiator protein DnaA [candidate division Zixibacteria bacterium]
MAYNNKELWDQCLSEFRSIINRQSFATWFEETEGVAAEGENLVVKVRDQFTADWLEQHHLEMIFDVITRTQGDSFRLTFAIPQGNGTYSYAVPELRKYKRYDPDTASEDRHLNAKYTFDSFVVGDFNRFAHAAALAVAEAPGKSKYSPLFIYGGTGLGKTHLIQAVGHFIKEENPRAKVIYVTSERFTSEFIGSLIGKSTAEFNRVYRNVDVLLVDDVHFFSGKESIQSEFFHIFNSLHQKGKQIILTSDVAPSTITGLEERLLSRFKWGLVVDIQPPDLEGRMAILRRKAEFDGIALSDEVLAFIAENVVSNVRELEGTLIRLLAFASISGCDIDISVAREVISHYSNGSSSKKIGPSDICREVSSEFGVQERSLQNARRTQPLALARQVAMYLCRELTDNSLKTIGLFFGGRDHSTVIHAINIIRDKLKSDSELADKIARIRADLSA